MVWEMTVGEDSPPIPRQRIRGTEQQDAFWAELLGGSRNITLEARAGTGKSTSCREGMWLLLENDPSLSIRYCCFNKKVSEEFAAKSPDAVNVGTMHSFGLQALQSAYRCSIEKLKTYMILDECGGRDLKRYIRKSIAMLVGLAKNHMYDPAGDDGKNILFLHELLDRFDVQTYRQTDRIVSFATKCLDRSAEMTSVVDFDDMLWLCVLHNVPFPGVDFLFIDEAQDLNGTQHAMAELMAGSGRTVVVGDPYQSIYAFRGADSQSMARLTARLDSVVMPLTITFRCPRRHVDLAREIVPDFQAAPEAPEGVLAYAVNHEAIERAVPGDLVLCRMNGPIISACLKAIHAQRPATVRGRAIGDSLLTILSGLNDPASIPSLLRALDAWKGRELSRLSERDGTDDLVEQVQDRAACLEVIARSCDTPSQIPGVIARLFSDDDAGRMVTFSSVHRAKGSEARRVMFLDVPYSAKRDRERPPQPWELQQRANLRYVALTRSLHSLSILPPQPIRESGDTPSLFEEETEL